MGFLDAEYEVADEFFSGVDKAATPAEHAFTAGDLHRDIERTRPLVGQRDSDGSSDAQSSRDRVLPVLDLVSEDGCEPHPSVRERLYPLRLLHDSATGCRDARFPAASSQGQAYEDSPAISLDMCTTMMAARCEYQIRADWDFNSVSSAWLQRRE